MHTRKPRRNRAHTRTSPAFFCSTWGAAIAASLRLRTSTAPSSDWGQPVGFPGAVICGAAGARRVAIASYLHPVNCKEPWSSHHPSLAIFSWCFSFFFFGGGDFLWFLLPTKWEGVFVQDSVGNCSLLSGAPRGGAGRAARRGERPEHRGDPETRNDI